jgi:hypothetical protein
VFMCFDWSCLLEHFKYFVLRFTFQQCDISDSPRDFFIAFCHCGSFRLYM